MIHRLLFVLIVFTPGILWADFPAPWATLVVGTPGEQENLANVDLQRFLAQVGHFTPQIMTMEAWKASPRPAVILGTPADNALIDASAVSTASLGDEGYSLSNATIASRPVVIAAGATPSGAVHAVYGLLKTLGYRFDIGSEVVPSSLPGRLPGDQPITAKPAFAIRGTLPWYNFFDSPTTWDPVDHRAFIDDLVRSGSNFVGFHTYSGEPFAGYRENGQWVSCGRLLDTSSPTWGTHPMPAKDFAYGTDQLYADDYFGAATTFLPDADAAVAAEQDVLRDAFDYAHRRGLHTCLGFEYYGDPTNPGDRTAFLKRLNHLLDQYPALDYVWLWQVENSGPRGWDPQSETPLDQYAETRWDINNRVIAGPDYQSRGTHDLIAQKNRAREAARIEQYAMLAYRGAGSSRTRA